MKLRPYIGSEDGRYARMLGEVRQQFISTPHSCWLLKEWHLVVSCRCASDVIACLVSPNTKICLPSNSY